MVAPVGLWPRVHFLWLRAVCPGDGQETWDSSENPFQEALQLLL